MNKSPLVQSLQKQWQGLSDRDKKILTFGLIAVILILLIKYVFFPTIEWKEQLNADLRMKQMTLKKMQKAITGRSKLEEDLERMKTIRKKMDRGLIQAKDADLASAELIKTIRSMASETRIQTSRISTNKSKSDDENFQAITLSIPSIRCDMKQLYDFLLKLRRSPKLLSLNELRIRLVNVKDPSEVTVNMDITGYMLAHPTPDEKEESTTNGPRHDEEKQR